MKKRKLKKSKYYQSGGKFTGVDAYNPYEEGAEIYQDKREENPSFLPKTASLQGSALNLHNILNPQAATNPNGGQPPQQNTQSFWDKPLTLNWNHILASQVIQGVGSAVSNASGNSYQNATLRYNEEVAPHSWLPQNPNTSNQALYGMQQGGIIDSYIRDFIFGDETPKESPKKKATNPDSKPVSESDVDEMVFNYEDLAAVNRPSRGSHLGKVLGYHGTANLEDIDPNVSSAVQELLAKFPALNITSGRRNWGDKDAHPKGRAVDLSGDSKIRQEAWDFYNSNLVPKYGFNPALPLNHGTGPHIHVGYYEQGGEMHLGGSIHGQMTRAMAKKILKDGKVEDKKLTSRQKHYFKHIADSKIVFKDGKASMKKEEGGYIDEMQQGGKTPITVNNPNDPRLQAYQDSLTLYNLNSKGPIEIYANQDKAATKAFATTENSPIGYTAKNGMNQRFAVYKKPVQPVVYGQPQQGSNKKPIVVNDPNDPRLRAYNDSLKVYNKYQDRAKNWNNAVMQYKVGTNDFNNLEKDYSDVFKEGKAKTERQMIEFMRKLDFSDTKLDPIGFADDDPDGLGMRYPMFKKPVQPVVYKKPEIPPHRASMRRNIPMEQDVRDLQLPQANPREAMDFTPKKTPFVYQYRDEAGQQQSVNLPDYETFKSFMSNQPLIAGSGDWSPNSKGAGATGHYLKLQDGGVMPNTGNPDMVNPQVSIEEALSHATKFKGDKTGKFKAKIPLEWWTDQLMDYTDKVKFKGKGENMQMKIRGKMPKYQAPVQNTDVINTTGYTEGTPSANNPMNVIPSGDITMARVYSPVVAIPVKGNKHQEPVVMRPGTDYAFDADYTMEFKAGGEYDLSPEHIKYLKDLGYDVEEIS